MTGEVNNFDGDLPKDLIREINQVSETLKDGWDSDSYGTLQEQVFLEYYGDLTEIDIEELRHTTILFENQESYISLSPRGEVSLGIIYEMRAIGEDCNPSLYILSGSMLTTGFAEDISDDRLKIMEYWAKGKSEEDIIVVKSANDCIDLYTRGICKEGYFVFLPVYTAEDMAQNAQHTDMAATHTPLGDYRQYSTYLDGEENPTTIFVSLSPVTTEQRIMGFQLMEKTPTGVSSYYF